MYDTLYDTRWETVTQTAAAKIINVLYDSYLFLFLVSAGDEMSLGTDTAEYVNWSKRAVRGATGGGVRWKRKCEGIRTKERERGKGRDRGKNEI